MKYVWHYIFYFPLYVGVILTEKWNTDNLLGTVVEIQDQFMRGLKVTLDSWYALQTGKRSGRVKADWITKNAAVSCSSLA